jgi:hypothetical protein
VHLGHLRATADEVSRDARHNGDGGVWLFVWVCVERNRRIMCERHKGECGGVWMEVEGSR